MPVKIQLAPRFQMRVNEKKYLELPTIQLIGTGNNVPHISRITCTVKGASSELALKIEKSYRQFESATPKISQIGQLEQYPCKLEQTFTQAINCNLQVIVEYFDSDLSGNPLLSARKKNSSLLSSVVTTYETNNTTR